MSAGPGSSPMTIDVDSTICEVHGRQRQGASYACVDHNVAYSITAPQNPSLKATIDAIDEDAWTPTTRRTAWPSSLRPTTRAIA